MQKLHDERTCNHNAINEVIIPRTLKDALGTHAALKGQETLQLTVQYIQCQLLCFKDLSLCIVALCSWFQSSCSKVYCCYNTCLETIEMLTG